MMELNNELKNKTIEICKMKQWTNEKDEWMSIAGGCIKFCRGTKHQKSRGCDRLCRRYLNNDYCTVF